jgi:superoxide reductase
MDRRNALKRLGALGLIASTAVPVMASEKEEFCDVYKKYSPKIHNRNFMKIKDPKHPTKGELKHTPEIKIGPTDKNGYTLVEITVGQNGIIHPSTENHWIDFIELDADGQLVARTIFEPGKAMGYAAYKVKLDGVKTLTAREGCNIHGIWEYTIKLNQK